MNKKQKIAVALTGASGSIYAKVLFDKLLQLKDQIEDVGVVMSENAKFVWQTELGNKDYEKIPFTFYEKQEFTAPFASAEVSPGEPVELEMEFEFNPEDFRLDLESIKQQAEWAGTASFPLH